MDQFFIILISTISIFLSLFFVYRFFDFFYTLYKQDKKNKKSLYKNQNN